jgi:hypothetical protein
MEGAGSFEIVANTYLPNYMVPHLKNDNLHGKTDDYREN